MARKKPAPEPEQPVDLKVELWPLSKVKPYERNPREITEEAVLQLAEYMLAAGFRDPIEVDGKGVILAGHRRYLAARKLKLERVPVIQHKDMSEEEAKAYRVASNKIAEGTGWNSTYLVDELRTVEDTVTLDLLGFRAEELGKLFAHEKAQEDEAKPTKDPKEKEAVCRSGDVWQLGHHQLVVGDKGQLEADQMILAWQKKTKGTAKLGEQTFAEVRGDRALQW